MRDDGSKRARAQGPSSVVTLARIGAVVILVILYALGGISLYVRAHVLRPPATATVSPTPRPAPSWTPLPTATAPRPTVRPSVTPTLYPTATPKALVR